MIMKKVNNNYTNAFTYFLKEIKEFIDLNEFHFTKDEEKDLYSIVSRLFHLIYSTTILTNKEIENNYNNINYNHVFKKNCKRLL